MAAEEKYLCFFSESYETNKNNMPKNAGSYFFKVSDAHKSTRILPIVLQKVQLQTFYLAHLTKKIFI